MKLLQQRKKQVVCTIDWRKGPNLVTVPCEEKRKKKKSSYDLISTCVIISQRTLDWSGKLVNVVVNYYFSTQLQPSRLKGEKKEKEEAIKMRKPLF